MALEAINEESDAALFLGGVLRKDLEHSHHDALRSFHGPPTTIKISTFIFCQLSGGWVDWFCEWPLKHRSMAHSSLKPRDKDDTSVFQVLFNSTPTPRPNAET